MAEEVLIVESAAEVASVLESLLDDEGYVTRRAVVDPEGAVEAVRANEPAVLALGLPPSPEAAGRVLDAVRTDPVARRIPVVAMATLPQVVDEAMASYTVRESVDEPFVLDEVVEKVERALETPPIQSLVGPATGDHAAARLEPALAERSRLILLDWAAAMRGRAPWSDRPDASTGEILGSAPTIVDALDAAMRLDEPTDLFDHPEVTRRIVAAAEARLAQGTDLVTAVTDLRELRDYLWAALDTPDMPPEDAEAARKAFDAAMERVIAITTPVFECQPTPAQ